MLQLKDWASGTERQVKHNFLSKRLTFRFLHAGSQYPWALLQVTCAQKRKYKTVMKSRAT